MKYKAFTTVIIASLACLQASAQESQPAVDTTTTATTTTDISARQAMNGWYIELAGASLLGLTFNYERFLSKKPGGLSIHAGAGGVLISLVGNTGGFVALPVGLSYNIPTSKKYHSFIELGGGYTFLSGTGGGSSGIYYPILGWRYLAQPTGLQFRATCLPFVSYDGDKIAPWFGFSIGKKFGRMK